MNSATKIVIKIIIVIGVMFFVFICFYFHKRKTCK